MVTFEKRKTLLNFKNRNVNPNIVTTELTGFMLDESGNKMLDENGDKMIFIADVDVRAITLIFEKRDTVMVFGERNG